MAKRSIEERETEEEEEDDEDDVIEEIFVEEDEDEEEEEELEAEEIEERKKRVCAGDFRERKAAIAVSSTATSLQQQQQIQRCQVDNCDADLGAAKKYHQRHRVCENHSKAGVVLVGGVDQRYCQQCSRFHELSQFDDAKRSCRERLAHHNERRRKIPPDQQTEDPSQIPVVLQVKESSPGQTRSWKPQKGHSEVVKIALPRNPVFKHFQIR